MANATAIAASNRARTTSDASNPRYAQRRGVSATVAAASEPAGDRVASSRAIAMNHHINNGTAITHSMPVTNSFAVPTEYTAAIAAAATRDAPSSRAKRRPNSYVHTIDANEIRVR